MNKNQIIVLVALSFIVMILPMLIYYMNFVHPEFIKKHISLLHFSANNSNWSNFGSFLSGIGGSIFSFFSLVAVLYTLYLTQKNNKEQLQLLKSELHSNEFNLLLDLLISRLKEKKYSNPFNQKTDFKSYCAYVYAVISIRIQNDHTSQDKTDFVYLNILAKSIISSLDKDILKTESNIYSVLLEKISSAPASLAEVFICILYAKLDNDYLFFLNGEQLSGNIDRRLVRLVKSQLPLTVPDNLMDKISNYV